MRQRHIYVMDQLVKYFPELNDNQRRLFAMFDEIYRLWNARINVISRRDIDNIYLHHIIHSLSIAKFLGSLDSDTTILDLGTGGGFPGIPLAVYYPHVKFHLIDRIAKKIRVCDEVITYLGLKNVTTQQCDIGECHSHYDYVVSRAVMSLDKLVPLVRKNIYTASHNKYANGLVCLKGGDLTDEIAGVHTPVIDCALSEFYSDDFFETKSLVYVPISTKKK